MFGKWTEIDQSATLVKGKMRKVTIISCSRDEND